MEGEVVGNDAGGQQQRHGEDVEPCAVVVEEGDEEQGDEWIACQQNAVVSALVAQDVPDLGTQE